MTTRRSLVGWGSAAVAAGTLALLAAGCGAQASEPQGSAQARRDVTLEWLAGANAVEEQIYKQIAATFEQANTPTKVAFVNGNAAGTDWQVKLETMAAAGTPPDVAWHGPEWFPGIVSKGIYKPIDSYLAKQPKNETADFFPRVMEQYGWEGKQYGVPASITVMTIFYNKDLFDKEGIAYPDGTWTFEGKYLDAARRLTKRDGGKLVQLGVGNPHRDWVWPWAGGADYLDKAGKKVTLGQSAEAAKWFQFAGDLRTKYQVAPSMDEQKAMQGGTRAFFLTGQVAMEIEGNWTLSDRKLIKNFTWDVAPIPMGSKARATPFFSTADMVCQGSKNPDEAFSLCWHIGNTASERTLSAEFGRVPARKSLWSHFTMLDNGLAPKNRKVIVDALEYAQSAPRFRDFREFDSRTLAPLMAQLNEGKITGQQLVTDMLPKLEQLAK